MECSPATHILVVDDDPLTLDVTARVLRNAGYRTSTASTGRQCEELLKEDPADILVLDVVLPDADGMDLCARFKADPAYEHIPILLLSSLLKESETQARGLESGADGYIARPVSNRELLARVELIDRQRHRDLEHREEHQRLRSQAIRDALTGVYNRHCFDDLISKEIARAKRHVHPIGLLMIDVDRFKEINDQFGHQMGDSVLREIAHTLSVTLRESDIIVRYGGDEFLVILVEPEDEVNSVAERVREAVRRNPVLSQERELEISISVGSLCWHPSSGTSFEDALATVDERMYENKRSPKM